MTDTENKAALENYNFQKIVVIVGFSLFVVKFVAYAMTSSVAILTDALESIVNISAGCIGLFALYLSAKPPDRSHPYGHGRVETISSSVEGTLIAVAGALIVFKALDTFLNPGKLNDLDIGILLIAFTAIVNFAVGRTAISRGNKNRSQALVASGKHLCTDTYSSLGIIFGLMAVFVATGAGFDVWWMDPGIALFFGALIMYTGFAVLRTSMDIIMDRADDEMLVKLAECINGAREENWVDIHSLRIVKYGSSVHMDMHLTLPPKMTIAECEKEKSKIVQAVWNMFGDSVDSDVSPEPCLGFNCRHCRCVCDKRNDEFTNILIWDRYSLAQKWQHTTPINVTLDRGIVK